MWGPDSNEVWRVVINIEDQYSIWPLRKEIPYGWSEVGTTGTKEKCLSYIKENWTDMRPRSLKEQMAKAANKDEAEVA